MNKKDYSNEYGEIYALYVDSEYRKKGIGQALINYAFDILKKKYRYILISTLVENDANKFYQKIGGKIIGKSVFKLIDNEYEENVYLYEL